MEQFDNGISWDSSGGRDSASLMASLRDVCLSSVRSTPSPLFPLSQGRCRERGPTDSARSLFPLLWRHYRKKVLLAGCLVMSVVSVLHLIKFMLGHAKIIFPGINHCSKVISRMIAQTICRTPKIGPLILSASTHDFTVLRVLEGWIRLSSPSSFFLPSVAIQGRMREGPLFWWYWILD